MPNLEIELNPADFVTIDTIGPKGQRVFYLQAGKDKQLVSMIIEKEQSWALSEAIRELLDDLDKRTDSDTQVDVTKLDMALREPIEPVFRVAQMGLGYDEENDRVVLIAQELVITGDEDESELEIDLEDDQIRPSVVRIWCTREQMAALSLHAMDTVKSGRADPRQNGRLVYYWT
ncbi:MAG TPA: DUF3090 family protein [Aggregatilineales bacterium]|jgi:uncharacterized repeat protein (TIGR03847 family)|nr:DUF3090 family protein [Aggregatilineales bacterium]